MALASVSIPVQPDTSLAQRVKRANLRGQERSATSNAPSTRPQICAVVGLVPVMKGSASAAQRGVAAPLVSTPCGPPTRPLSATYAPPIPSSVATALVNALVL